MTQVDLRSDNVAGAAPEILDAVMAANHGTSLSYGADSYTGKVTEVFGVLFERDCIVHPIITGTATNALSLSLLTPAWGAVICSETGHVHDSECGAVELQTGGAKMMPIFQRDGRIEPETLEEALASTRWSNTANAPPKVLSIAQATERGTVYRPEHLIELTEIARRYGMRVHMDGARFANAVVSLGCTPAELSWRVGVDVLSFGGTKNGCLCAEAIVCFDDTMCEALRYRVRKAGHVPSKMRFVSAQLLALLENDRWLTYARNANRMAERLSLGLGRIPSARLLHPVEANEVFMWLPGIVTDTLISDGFGFYDRGNGYVRMVTAFDTREEDVDAFVASACRYGVGAEAER